MAPPTIIGYTFLEVISVGAGGIFVTVVSALALKGLKATRNGAKPPSTLTNEVGEMKGDVKALESNCRTRHDADDKRYRELKDDLTADIGRVEQAVKDQGTSTNTSIKGVHKRLDEVILVLRGGHAN